MSWWQYAILGAGGGVLVEALTLLKWTTVWQNDRRAATGKLKSSPPTWRRYVDVPVHAWLLLIRAPLGAGAALLFGMTGQISGPYAAVAFGFAAPAVLAQLGSIPQVSDAVRGGSPREAAASETPVGPRLRVREVESAKKGGTA